ncbi:phosphoenolpyruvate carboxylase [Thermodesulfatator autotrophicus]|uniref:Phosphoenolpyruvate carboxylase n=1 Tax=Thermodesulfatator autotrophicus TaxID=1795632 RepID=A0A177E9Y1_9BACT|nr:phosphoenolpyruvate carboxylase [Thermodesulfatator autotrophicus]OAG28608.1 hypothetical protein TH606_00470 [Thermodesulfatator autotrophicus]
MLRDIFQNLVTEGRGLFPSDSLLFKPVDRETDILGLYEDLKIHLRHFRSVTDENPFANPILLLAIHLTQRLEKGEITFSALEQLIQFLDTKAYVVRAERIGQYVSETEPLKNLEVIEKFIENLPGLKEKDWETFAVQVAREFLGIVITGHPTFALRFDLLRALSDLASGRNLAGVPLNKEQIKQLLLKALHVEHLPEPDITLEKEHSLALEAISNLKKAILRLYDLVYKVAKEHFPEKWWEIRPRLITVASWVGYDLDGRRDIDWARSFTFRLEERKLSLKRYQDQLQALLDLCPISGNNEALREGLAQALKVVTENLEGIDEEIEVFRKLSENSLESLDDLRRISQKMYKGLSRRLTRPSLLISWVDEAIGRAQDYPEILHRLCLLRAEIDNFGLGGSHIHVRLNSKQIHNAIRTLIGLETDPEDPSAKKTYLKTLDNLLAEVSPVTINFGSLLAERTTAKRLFMLVTQMAKYIDSETPIRFLIAETESSFTSIAALYFAKLFNVEEIVDISPLLETPRALIRGARIVDEMFSNYYFRNYVLLRGRFCIQTGFSDAGRHLGQTAAGFIIENFRRRLAKLLNKHKLNDIELVIFNTHGESIGRGAHPASFEARLNYLMSPRSRKELTQVGIDLKEEVSFQGGDGYVYFLNPYLALGVLARIFEFIEKSLKEPDNDPFYQEWDYIFEFFTTIQQFNEQLMQDPDYALLLNDYGRNFLFPTGSRPIKRQFEIEKSLLTAAEIRAIPHNAVLHQLGLLAIPMGGIGQAIKKNPEIFLQLQKNSPRFKLIISMAEYALSFSDFYAFLGYINVLDPGFWLMLSAKADNSLHAEELRQVANSLEAKDYFTKFSRIGRFLGLDLLLFTEILQVIYSIRDNIPGVLYDRDGLWMDKRVRDYLEILHAIRLAIIYHIFTLAVQIPDFSPQRGTTREEVIERILCLEVEEAVKVLKEIFPLLEYSTEAEDFGEKATYQSERYLGYFQEHQNIFIPLESLYRLVKRITGGVTHIIGSFG